MHTARRVIPRLFVGVTALLSIGGATAALAGTVATKAVVFSAFKPSGKPSLRIQSTVHGSCNGGSSAINRDDAWRCFAGNFVYDPCFSSPHAGGIVVCPAAPWSGLGVEIKLTSKLSGADHGKPSTSGMPWAIWTITGLKCEMDTGATTAIGGRRANYFCAHSKMVLWGSPSRKTKLWTIYAAPASAKKLTTKVGILTAWF